MGTTSCKKDTKGGHEENIKKDSDGGNEHSEENLLAREKADKRGSVSGTLCVDLSISQADDKVGSLPRTKLGICIDVVWL